MRSARRYPRNLAGKGLDARQKINEALRKQPRAKNAKEIQKAMQSPTQPGLFS